MTAATTPQPAPRRGPDPWAPERLEVRLPEGTRARLRAVAQSRRVPVAVVVRDALEPVLTAALDREEA